MSKNLSDLSGRHGLDYNLFEQLGIVVNESGAVDPIAIEKLRDDFLVGKSNLYGALSFYDFLRPENKGKMIVTVACSTGVNTECFARVASW